MAEARIDILTQIERLVVPEGQLALWALGQSGFVIKGGDMVACIDPYLSDAITSDMGGPPRCFPAPLDPATLTSAQVVFTTHEHADHTDPATLLPLLDASPDALVVGTSQTRAMLQKQGVAPQRIVVPKIGDTLRVDELTYTAVPAAHYVYDVDDSGYARWMGFLICLNGVTLYHAGDTVIVPELLRTLDGVEIDIALLPFNGRDFFREESNLVGNMLPSEAVQFASRIKAHTMIGVHNDLFATNRVGTDELFAALDRYAPRQRCHVLQPGELYLYAR